MQTLYAYTTGIDTNKPTNPQKTLKNHFDQTRALLVYIVYYFTEIARYAEKDAYRKSHKYIPTEKDLNVNTKLAGSNLLWQILELPEYKTLLKSEKPEQYADEDLVKKTYQQLITTQEYLHYISIQQQNLQEDRKIFDYILNQFLLGNEAFLTHIEESFSNWDDDAEILLQVLPSFIRKPASVDLQVVITEDKEQYATKLLRTVIEKENYLLNIIKPKLKNWDSERIALLDMVLMKMGVAEFLYFDTIPPKVTINEYIDLAKDYSTAESGHFINGILDSIHKELVQEGKLIKKDFRKV